MNNYRVVLKLEPTDKYLKAQQDLLQALKSYNELSEQEKEPLMLEVFGANNIAMAIEFSKRCRR